jgi:hypothetical protein
MNSYIELKVACEALEHFPLPEGLRTPVKVQHKDIPVLITPRNIQFYFKGGMFAVDRRLATKLLELLQPDRDPVPRRTHLAFTRLFIHNQKIGGIIMDFTLNQATPSVQLLVQDLNKDGAILPDIDSVTGHPTLQPGSLKITGDGNIVVTQDPTNPALVTVARANNTTNAVSTLTATATNDDGETITGTSQITVVSDPIVDNGIAETLQFVLAPVVAAPAPDASAQK